MKLTKIKSMKNKRKISVLTCYDYSFAKIFDQYIDILLVGDSLGNVVLGYKKTKKVTMQDMIRHTAAVARGSKKALIIGDMPYLSDKTPNLAIKNAKLLLKAGADAVKPEGKPNIVKALTKANIPVMGHLGLLPQTDKLEVKGRKQEQAKKIIKQAKEIEKAGAFCLVLESIPSKLAKIITKSISIPTIGIGAGPHCNGQVLVSYDMLGLFDDFKPKFVKQYVNLNKIISKAVKKYSKEVKKAKFPTKQHSFK